MTVNKKYGYLLAEAVVLFVGMPLLFYWDVVALPKIAVLLLAAGYCGWQLWRDPDFGKGLLSKVENSEAGKSILWRLPLVVASLAGLIALVQPSQFFAFPTERPIIWMAVMVLYPLLSALPQELIFRTYFFHRYQSFFSMKYGAVIASALAFSFLHIIYDNWWAMGISFVGGLLFGITYERTRSLFWVTVEHAIYGCLVFTIGMGSYFYEAF